MRIQTVAAVAGVALLAGFLMGFLPERSKMMGLRSALESAEQRVETYRRDSEVNLLRDLAARMYLDAEANNYGLASGTATEFFDRVSKLAANTAGRLASDLNAIAKQRDQVTGALAQTNANVLSDLRDLLRRTLALTTQG